MAALKATFDPVVALMTCVYSVYGYSLDSIAGLGDSSFIDNIVKHVYTATATTHSTFVFLALTLLAWLCSGALLFLLDSAQQHVLVLDQFSRPYRHGWWATCTCGRQA